MRVRMFMPQFGVLVVNGLKRQTVRPWPKRLPKVGDRESWRVWSAVAYRSPQIELLQVELTEVREIHVFNDRAQIHYPERRLWDVLTSRRLLKFAKADGFKDWTAMREWFWKRHGLPFHGILIKAK